MLFWRTAAVAISVGSTAPTNGWPSLWQLLSAAEGDDQFKPPPRFGSIEALNQRDPDSWKALFDDEMPAIYKYALSRIGNATEAEDLTSHVFEEAWKNSSTLEDRGIPARGWLFGIARNVVGSHRRKLFRRPPALAIEGYDSPTEEQGIAPELMDVARAIAQLPKSQAEVITFRFIHGLSLQETAQALATTVDSVKGRQARALASLKDLLGSEYVPSAEAKSTA